MSSVSLPVTRPSGRAIIVASSATRPQLAEAIGRLGYAAAELDDPYTAMLELCRRPLAYRAVVLSLGGIYREELNVIAAIKRRYAHVDIWLTHIEGRQAALAEAMRLGADGLLSEEGLHRIALAAGDPARSAGAGLTAAAALGHAAPDSQNGALRDAADAVDDDGEDPDNHDGLHASSDHDHDDLTTGEPVLTADELRALLQEQPAPPPAGTND